MSALEHVSLPDAVTRTLRRRILNAEIPAGARLIETQLAEEFEVSRTTVREALRTLEAEGLVELAPRRHCVVTRMDETTAADVLFARCTLELAAAREWLLRGGADLSRHLRAAIEVMEKAAGNGDMLAAVEADTLFHGHLVSAGARVRLAQLWHILDGQMGALMRSSLERQHANLHDLARLHLDLVNVLSSKDEAAIVDAIAEHYLDHQLDHRHEHGSVAARPAHTRRHASTAARDNARSAAGETARCTARGKESQR